MSLKEKNYLKGDTMNPVLKAIAERRAVRSYEFRPVPKDIINKIRRGRRGRVSNLTLKIGNSAGKRKTKGRGAFSPSLNATFEIRK
jgi:hypothetical protein